MSKKKHFLPKKYEHISNKHDKKQLHFPQYQLLLAQTNIRTQLDEIQHEYFQPCSVMRNKP